MSEASKRLSQDPRRLYLRRVRARLSQEQLASRAGVSKSTVSRLENGKCPAEVETIHRLAEALGCAVEELMPVDLKAV